MAFKRGAKIGAMRFWYNMFDNDDRPINPQPLELEANDLGHALQKIAGSLADDCVEVSVWKARAVIKLVEKHE